MKTQFSPRSKASVFLWLFTGICFLFLSTTAQAHTETGAVGGLLSGFKHSLTRVDHLVAMIALKR